MPAGKYNMLFSGIKNEREINRKRERKDWTVLPHSGWFFFNQFTH
jgi:hypothetical protein